MTTAAMTGVRIARGALILGISKPLCVDGSFRIGAHASHLLMLLLTTLKIFLHPCWVGAARTQGNAPAGRTYGMPLG